MEYNKKIILEDGSEYYGRSFGADNERVCEIVFNTSMVGYQEIISDPSYTYQAVVMTYPLIGNYGINDDDFETSIPTIGGLIVREYNDFPSIRTVSVSGSSYPARILQRVVFPNPLGAAAPTSSPLSNVKSKRDKISLVVLFLFVRLELILQKLQSQLENLEVEKY